VRSYTSTCIDYFHSLAVRRAPLGALVTFLALLIAATVIASWYL
jgi:hypothetical protein